MAMKEQRNIILLSGLLGIIIFLSIRNDYVYNEERCVLNDEKTKKDSKMHKQTDSIVVLLNQVSNQLDSMRIEQKDFHAFEIRNNDTIKTFLGIIERKERRILNLMK